MSNAEALHGFAKFNEKHVLEEEEEDILGKIVKPNKIL